MENVVSEDTLKSLSTPTSFSRGDELYQDGAIFDTSRQSNVLRGKCRGSSAPYYEIVVRLDEGGIQEAYCSCPYSFGGLCKHIIALMLTFIHSPDEFAEQKSVYELLESLSKDEIISVILKLVNRYPELYTWLQNETLVVSETSQPVQLQGKSRVSQAVYQNQIRRILSSLDGYRMSEAYWMMGDMVAQLSQIGDTAFEFLQAGDAQGALIIFSTLFIETGKGFSGFDDSDGYLSSFIEDLALPLCEAILSADLSNVERIKIYKKLEPIIRDLHSYGFDDLDVILIAINRGWSDEPLIEAEDYNPRYANYLNEVKLNILERKNHIEEYLKICLKSGAIVRYVLKQIEIGEIDRALEVAFKNIASSDEALAVAIALRKANRLSDALSLAEKGLEMEGRKNELGLWLGPMEETQGRTEQAIQAYLAAYYEAPTLELYNALKRLTAENWLHLRPILMLKLQENPSHTRVLADVYLAEQEWDQAIAIACKVSQWDYVLLEKVVDAVLPHRPDWVIQVCEAQADGLIARTQSKYYSIAVNWLGKMKKAYISTGRKAEWLEYLENLKAKYYRRPALQAELRRL